MNNANHTIDALALRIAVREVAGRETRGISEDGKSARPHTAGLTARHRRRDGRIGPPRLAPIAHSRFWHVSDAAIAAINPLLKSMRI
jgi:hypothetical protein